jgi:hypothetical protein
MVALICCRIGVSWRGSFLAALVCVALMAQYLVALGGGLTELFAAVPLATALWLLFRTPGWRGFASIGGLVGLALVLSVQVIPAGLLLIVFAVMRARSKPASVLALAAGSSAVAILILGWLGVSGALPAAYDDVVRYGAAYRDTAIRAGFTLTGPVVAWTLLATLGAVAPAAIGLLGARRIGGRCWSTSLLALAWIALTIGWFVLQARFFAHYAAPLAVPLAILAGIGIDQLRTRRRLPTRVAVVAGAFVVSIVAAFVAGRMESDPVAADNRRADAVAGVIRSTTAGGETIWVWGNKPQLYLAARRRDATAYDYLYPLVTPGYGSAAQIDKTLESLRERTPAVIVDAGSFEPGAPGFQPLLIPRPVASDGRDLDLLGPLRSYVAAHYRASATVAGWVVYVRK